MSRQDLFVLAIINSMLSGKPSDDDQIDGPVGSAVVVGAIAGGSISLLLCIAFIACLLCRKRSKNPREKPVEEVDENPVYSMYYFADGYHNNDGNVEVDVKNQMYGT